MTDQNVYLDMGLDILIVVKFPYNSVYCDLFNTLIDKHISDY
jgi:hypothetical protein